MMKDPYNRLISQPRDCNKANGAEEQGGWGRRRRCIGSPSNLLCETYRLHVCDVSSAPYFFSVALFLSHSLLSCLYNPLLYDSFMLSSF